VNRSVWRLELLKSNVSWLEAVPNMAVVSRFNRMTHNPILSSSLSGGAHDRWQSRSSVGGGGLALVVAAHNRVRVRILVGDLSPMELEEVREEVCGPDDGAAGRHLSHGRVQGRLDHGGTHVDPRVDSRATRHVLERCKLYPTMSRAVRRAYCLGYAEE
jgi:hypothetical protein